MKKIILFLSVIVVMLSSCDSSSYKIEGNFNDTAYDGQYVYLQTINDVMKGEPAILDSAKIEGGKFTLKGKNEKPIVGFVSLGKMVDLKHAEPDKPSVATLILEPGTINLSFDKALVTLSGTSKNEQFNKLHALMNQGVEMQKSIGETGALSEDVQARFNDLYKNMQNETYLLAKDNMNNAVGEFLLMTSTNLFNKEQLTELLAVADTSITNKPEIKRLKEFIDAQVEKEAKVIGKPYTDVELSDVKGKSVKLSDYVGKGYVLVDFWASWCRPCVEEIPNLKKAYSTYKDKGFEILGVSIDEDESDWKTALDTHKMPWTQVRDGKQAASIAYDISQIPFTLLIDKDGTVVAMNLRGEELEKKLSELLP